jgi:hypothetical protein
VERNEHTGSHQRLGLDLYLSAEIFFAVKVRLFSLRLRLCSWFCMVILGLLGGVLAWCSMLVCVVFNVAMRGYWLC